MVVLATFQVFSSHVQLVATLLDSMDIAHYHHCRKFYWTVPVYNFSLSTIARKEGVKMLP